MTEITYRQPRRRLMIVLVVAYLVVLITLGVVFSDQASTFVNGLAQGGASGTGLIVGVICLAPLFVILALATERVTVRQDAATLSIDVGRSETTIARRDIHRIRVNEPRVASIRLFAQNGAQLVELAPRMQEYPRMIDMLTDDGSFVEVERRPAFAGRVTVVTYERQQRPVSSRP